MKSLKFGVLDVHSSLILFLSAAIGNCNMVLQTLEDVVGAGNFTYFRLSRHGHLQLELQSLKGDADIYISDSTLKPTYNNFEFHSVTCGMDVVDVPSYLTRPIGIGIYGHPYSELSHFKLKIIFLGDKDENAYPETMEFSQEPYQKPQKTQKHYQENAEDEPILWQILITILKVIFDILL